MEMTPDKWEKVKVLFEAVLERPAEQRLQYLRSACEDDDLCAEVARLVANLEDAGSFLSKPSPRSSDLLTPPHEPGFLTPGRVLAGRFKLVRFLARGGMGEVYEAEDEELQERVALKLVRPELLLDSSNLQRFKREVHLAKNVTHSNICRTFDFFRDRDAGGDSARDVMFVTMELLVGETLSQYLRRRGRLTQEEALPLITQIGGGMSAAHGAGIVHRDFKPGNIILVSRGTTSVRAVITDFGLARRSGGDATTVNTRITVSQGVAGTPAYMAPEQIEGHEITPATDIYAFGLVIYEMLTGELPFSAETPLAMAYRRVHEPPPSPRSIIRDLDPNWETVIMCCLERDPTKRFPSANDVVQALSEPTFRIKPESGIKLKKVLFPHSRLWKIAVTVGLVALLFGGGLYYRSHQRRRLTDEDIIVLADFANSTGDAIFDDTLKTALRVSLGQSPFLNVLSDDKVATTMELMARPSGAKLTPELARELCRRANGKAYVGGSIGSLGTEYVMGLKAVNCQNGKTLAQEQVTVASKDKVLDALGTITSKLRSELGESLQTVQRFDVPLAEATTSSFEALKAYSQGSLQQAIQLDPNFAMAFKAIGDDYAVRGQKGRSSEYFTRAFELRDRASEREKLLIAASYYENVSGDRQKAKQVYQDFVASYPREGLGYFELGNQLTALGQYEEALDTYRQYLQIDPNSIEPSLIEVNSLLALQRFPEARQAIQQIQARNSEVFLTATQLYTLAFLEQDLTGLTEAQKWFVGKPEEMYGLCLASDTEAYVGHLRRARELTKRSVQATLQTDSRENGGGCLLNEALREIAFGNATYGRQVARKGLRLTPANQGIGVEGVLAMAMAGDDAEAESLAQELNKEFPVDTQMQSLWLPAVRAQIALNRKNPTEALNDLQPATGPIELGQITFVANISCLYHTYIRGEAYLAAGQGRAAAGEFQKIRDHSGIVWNCFTGALASLGVARANVLQSKTSRGADADAARVRALTAYKDFLTLWKDADPDIPVLKQAKAEYAKLQ